MCPANLADMLRVEKKILAAQASNPGSVALLLILGDLRDAEGRYDEAVADYREVLKSKPDDILALNNLAWLLAFRYNENKEALELLEKAIGLAGPRPGLLDTRGVIYSRNGQHQKAQSDLEEGIAQQPDGVRYLHLAQIFLAQDKKDEATKALKNADELGVKNYEIHALEREALSNLRQVLQSEP